MSGLYVASNVGAIGAMYTLQRNNAALGETLTRLSTGLRINSGKDDPAGLIASELLKSDIAATEQAVKNTQRANSMIAVADSALSQVGTLLNDIRVLVNEGANEGAMSDDQIAANQLQIDASIDSIDRIAKTTNFQGKKLLDGSLDFNTTGIDTSKVSNVNIQQANFGTAENLAVKINVMEEAKKGTLIFNGTGVGTDTVLEIGGSEGSEIFKFGAGTTTAEMAEAINRVSDATGVEAHVEGVAQRGSVILDSAGANNDILITANEVGYDEGNYTFRIVQGATNDVRVVTEPDASSAGIIEIQLQGSYEKTYSNFAGMYDITVNTDWATDATQQATSITMTQGTGNTVEFFETDSNATGTTSSGITATLTTVADGSHQSAYNGWTVVVDDSVTAAAGVVDHDSKTIRVNSADLDDGGDQGEATSELSKLLDRAVGGADTATGETELTITGGTLVSGDSFTLGGGGTAGELFITYKEGATVGEIQDLINNAPNVQATLANGVSADDLVKNIPDGLTHVETATAAGANTMSRYTSAATSQTVIDLINSKLGDKFTAVALDGDNTNGRVSYQDAAVIYGDVNQDNAVQISGMDSGPVVRMVTGSENQSLGVTIRQPSDADIAAGVHTPILEIQLATDASGNSTTTAKELADFFDTLTAEQTLGVSVEVYYPEGVDPNGRTWVDDGCGNISIVEDCGASYGAGIVQPTGIDGDCDVTQNDLILLGNNQATVASQATAGISSVTTVAGLAAVSAAGTGGGTNFLTFGTDGAGGTSAVNGLTFGFTFDETQEGFDETTGTLTMFIDSKTAAITTPADQTAAVTTIVDSAIAANWESIRAYTGATGNAVKVTSITSGAAALADAASGGTTEISGSTETGAVVGTRGVGINDSALTITAKQSGTDWAGVKVYFEQDDSLTAYTAGGNVDISVTYQELEDGTSALVVKGNMGATTGVDSIALATALNSNETFSKYFTADANMNTADTAVGTVGFSTDPTKAAGVTTGGYRVDSDPSNAGNYTGTSSGISMSGQSDSSERLVLKATEYGSAHFVDVNVVSGTFNTYCPMGLKMDHLAGTDVVASVNGQKAEGTGTEISVSSSSLQMTADVGGMKGGETTEFTINGGGATFQIGPDVVSTQQVTLGIKSVNSANLGGASGLLYQLKTGENASLKNDTKLADRIVQEAISSIANTRGRLGAIQKSTFEPNISVLEDTIEQLSSAEALISNADFAVESSNLTRLQLLVQSASTALSLANQTPQYAARLVG